MLPTGITYFRNTSTSASVLKQVPFFSAEYNCSNLNCIAVQSSPTGFLKTELANEQPTARTALLKHNRWLVNSPTIETFSYWHDFGFTEKLQEWYKEFPYTLYLDSPNNIFNLPYPFLFVCVFYRIRNKIYIFYL